MRDEELSVDEVRGKLVLCECSFDDFFAPALVVAGISVEVCDSGVHSIFRFLSDGLGAFDLPFSISR